MRRTRRLTAIGGTAAGVSLSLIHLAPLTYTIMVGTLLLLTATVVLPAVWSSKKYRRDAAYAVLKLVIDPSHQPRTSD